MPDINLTIKINAKPDKVYKALTEQKHLSRWWTTSCSAKPFVGSKARFNFKKANFYNVMEIAKLVHNKRVEWKCIEAGDKSSKEWEGTRVLWEIKGNNDGTTSLHMAHKGWKGKTELYKICTDGWAYYAGESLKEYLEIGKGKPYSNN